MKPCGVGVVFFVEKMDANQLAQVEHLCQIIYGGSEPARMKEAEVQVLGLQSSVEFVPQCQFILDNTKLNYAQLLAAKSLETLVTKFWNIFTPEQKGELRHYVLNYVRFTIATTATTTLPTIYSKQILLYFCDNIITVLTTSSSRYHFHNNNVTQCIAGEQSLSTRICNDTSHQTNLSYH